VNLLLLSVLVGRRREIMGLLRAAR
jgi:hypothetical protein